MKWLMLILVLLMINCSIVNTDSITAEVVGTHERSHMDHFDTFIDVKFDINGLPFEQKLKMRSTLFNYHFDESISSIALDIKIIDCQCAVDRYKMIFYTKEIQVGSIRITEDEYKIVIGEIESDKEITTEDLNEY